MTLEELAHEFWWCVKLYRTKGDSASYEALMTLANKHHLPPRLQNRVAEIRREHDRNELRGPSVA